MKNPVETRGVGLCAAIVLGKGAVGVTIARAQRDVKLDLVHVGFSSSDAVSSLFKSLDIPRRWPSSDSQVSGAGTESCEGSGNIAGDNLGVPISDVGGKDSGMFNFISAPEGGCAWRGYQSDPLY